MERLFRLRFGRTILVLAVGFCASRTLGEITVDPWTSLYRGVDHAVGYADTDEAWPQLVNCLRIDLADSDIQFVTTPSNGPDPLETLSATGTQFLAATGAHAGVNTSFYAPCCSTQPENKDLIGLAVSDGELVSPAQPDARAAALIDALNQVSFVNTVTDPYSLDGVLFAFAGSNFVLGTDRDIPTGPDTIHPARTLVGVGDRDIPGDNALLYFVTIDAGLAGVSDGATRRQSAEWLFRFGAHTGVNLDGGGSTTMVWRTPSGSIQRLNMLGGGTQRSNGNNVGVFAAPSDGVPQPLFTPVWFAGLPDNSVADFSAEDGTSNPPPGSPDTLDDDYYFAGLYPDPIGVVADDEPLGNLERAVIHFDPPNDDTLRFHFNLSAAEARASTQFRYSLTVFQQDGQGALSVQIEVLFNDVSVDVASLTESTPYTSPVFDGATVGAIEGANVLTVRQVGGNAQWTSFDFHRLEAKVALPPWGDMDHDGDVDHDDLLYFLFCLQGPGVTYLPGHMCLDGDADADMDVDLADFAQFQTAFGAS
ncbi:MAG: phosphodiester glycosidase family protein [Phycisphaerales bacterium]|nr:MAG: phosphodiester glycosidase family protein [Phycisphaerales bacterium]